MFPTDESLGQIASAGRIVAAIRTNAELLASPNVTVISANFGQVNPLDYTCAS